jgi:hypothetical protein
MIISDHIANLGSSTISSLPLQRDSESAEAIVRHALIVQQFGRSQRIFPQIIVWITRKWKKLLGESSSTGKPNEHHHGESQ